MSDPLWKVGDLVLTCKRHNNRAFGIAVITKIKIQSATGYTAEKIFYDMYDFISNDVKWLTEENMLYFRKEGEKSSEYIEVISP